MIIDVLDLCNMTMLYSVQLLKKDFQVKMFGIFLSCCILYVLDHILSYCIGFLDLENVCLDTKIMCL